MEARKKAFGTQRYRLPPPKAAAIVGKALTTMVPSIAPQMDIAEMDIMTSQKRRVGLKGSLSVVGGERVSSSDGARRETSTPSCCCCCRCRCCCCCCCALAESLRSMLQLNLLLRIDGAMLTVAVAVAMVDSK